MRSHLDPSELGTKAYWDEAYKREITNHSQDASDEGTIWFDDSGAEEKVIERLESLEEQALLRKEDEKTEDEDQPQPASRILDLGTGNGHMIFALEEEGWMGDMVGVDYSDASVQLARQIAAQKNQDASQDLSVRFEKWDILNQQPGSWLADGFDAVLDKGTFDAISLSSETDAQGRRVCEYYCEKITPLIRKGSFFIITSCNWTKEELLHWFVFPDGELHFFGEAKYPTFTFGGHQGQSVCTLIFQRR